MSHDRAHDDHHHDGEVHEHDLGLVHDLPVLMSRRRALGVLTGGVGVLLAGCGSSSPSGTATTGVTTTGTTAAASGAAAVPEETAGPYPGDGSNGPNVLTASGVERRDIRTSIGDASGTAPGAEARVALKLIDVAGGGGPLAGAAVYIWHCDVNGRYSLYDDPIASENYLRGVQVSDDRGELEFVTAYPGCYSGRWPHIHFEVYESLDAAVAGGQKLRTSQIALPQAACEQVYATAGYETSAQNLPQNTLDGDMVFADGYASQLATVTGSVGKDLTMRLNVGV